MKFNITGTCIPGKHYMADTSGKIKQIAAMVEEGEYFTINRPRQYGKTTTLYLLQKELKRRSGYLVLRISFEGLDSSCYKDSEIFNRTLLELIKDKLLLMNEEKLVQFLDSHITTTKTLADLSRLFSRLIKASGKKTVLIIDEVDKSSNNQLFLDFLGIMRTKYLDQAEGEDITFHSVVLAGVHDIKTLKTKIRSENASEYNSPWNIAADFTVDLSLFPGEIVTMLGQYSQETNVIADSGYFADKLYYYTSGYPFLVSQLCKIVDEEILPGKTEKKWEHSDLDRAMQIIAKKENTNFSSLIKNLENNTELYDFVFDLIMNENDYSFNPDNSIIHFGVLYGILKGENGRTRVHNKVYEQQIYNYMASNLETSGGIRLYTVESNYYTGDGALDMEKVIEKFQVFMKEQHSTKGSDFIERNGRLLFLAFLKPILNGRGFDFKEVQVSEERRIDVIVTVGTQKHIIELKKWRGEKYHQKGILQLCDYLDRQNQPKGYLLIYDSRKKSHNRGKREEIKNRDKQILAAWV